MVKLFLPSTVKFNRLTLKMWLVSKVLCTAKCNNLFDIQVLVMFTPIQCTFSGEHTLSLYYCLFLHLYTLFLYCDVHGVTNLLIFLKLDYDVKDGERLPLAIKDMGPCEMFPQTLSHNPNGRYG